MHRQSINHDNALYISNYYINSLQFHQYQQNELLALILKIIEHKKDHNI